MAIRSRPLSPHLSVYRWTLTMAMSIFHRATGIALYVGTLLLVLWLGAAAIGGDALSGVEALFANWFGQLVLFGYTWALFHHMLGGLRHFIWDKSIWMEHPQRDWLALANIVGSVALTLIAWSALVWFK